jgi:cell division protein FtsB
MADSPTSPARTRTAPHGPHPWGDTRHWWVRYAIAFVFAVLVVNAVAGERGYLELRRFEQRHADAGAALAARRAENAALRSAIHRMRTDPGAVEEAVRRQLGYARAGEIVFTVRDARPRPAPTSPPAPAVPAGSGRSSEGAPEARPAAPAR